MKQKGKAGMECRRTESPLYTRDKAVSAKKRERVRQMMIERNRAKEN